MARRFDFGYYFSEGFHSIFTHGFMSFAAVCMTVACLLIMGSFSLLAVNLEHMLGDLEAENEMLAYIDDSYSEERAKGLQAKLEQVPNVSSAVFVSKEEALEDYLEGRAENELLESLPAEVLRDRYRIRVDNIEEMSSTKVALEAVTGIAKVRAALEIAQGFVMVRNIAGGVAVVLIVMLLLVSLFIISNTIKLAFFYRREEISIMKMCGATNGFIRWPFVVEGMILGLTGALVAFFLQWGIYELVGKFVLQSNGISLFKMLSYGSMVKTILPIFCGTGLAIGVGGSLMAIRKFLQVCFFSKEGLEDETNHPTENCCRFGSAHGGADGAAHGGEYIRSVTIEVCHEATYEKMDQRSAGRGTGHYLGDCAALYSGDSSGGG